jgi:hypothetical protein
MKCFPLVVEAYATVLHDASRPGHSEQCPKSLESAHAATRDEHLMAGWVLAYMI